MNQDLTVLLSKEPVATVLVVTEFFVEIFEVEEDSSPLSLFVFKQSTPSILLA